MIKKILFIIIFSTIISLIIISGLEYKQNQNIKFVCRYPYFESCEILNVAKEYCNTAKEQFEIKNCSIISRNQ